jgi:hypothetical protein
VLSELKRYGRLPRSRRLLLWETLIALAVARLAMLFLPFRIIADWLGTPGRESAHSTSDIHVEVAAEIGWAVRCLAHRLPWDSRCLAQALAATWMLRRRGLESTVTFGANGGSHDFVAHAWLRFGSCLLTGGLGHERFKTLTSLAREDS